MFLLWPIKLMYLFVHIFFRWFTIWALCWCFSFLYLFLIFFFSYLFFILCLSFLEMMLEIEKSQVGDFTEMARSAIDFCNISCIFIWWDVISYNMEDNMIRFISYYRFGIVYRTPYFCTVRWPYIDIPVSSLTTNCISI